MDLKQIHAMWNEDCVIHEMKLDEASRDAPLLHSKYLELLSHTKLKLKRAEAQHRGEVRPLARVREQCSSYGQRGGRVGEDSLLGRCVERRVHAVGTRVGLFHRFFILNQLQPTPFLLSARL